MKIFVFKSNINNQSELNNLIGLFMIKAGIDEWSVDFEDIDKVLRIVTRNEITEKIIIDLVNSVGHQCEELKD